MTRNTHQFGRNSVVSRIPRRSLRLPLVFLLPALLAFFAAVDAAKGQGSAAGNPVRRAEPTAADRYGRLPLSFEANLGQSDPQVRFLARGEGYSLFFTGSGAALSLPNRHSIRMQLTHSSATARVSGEDQLSGIANYFLGNDPANWHRNIPTYSRVKYSSVYPGIDLAYYGAQEQGGQNQLEYDFLVAPGANPGDIRFRLTGADRLRVNGDGDLLVSAGDREISFRKPLIYQETDGQREPVHGGFALLHGDTVGFRLGSYDHGKPLVIDPVLVYSTYIGDTGGASSNAIAVDAEGYAYIAGIAESTDFPVTTGAYQTKLKGGSGNAFVCKMNQAGTALVYCTFLGGSNDQESGVYPDTASAVAIDAQGDAYVAGETTSTDFPTTASVVQPTNTNESPNGGSSFVSKLSPTGNALVYSTYLNSAIIAGLAIDSSGNAYVTGDCWNSLAVTAGAFQTKFPIPNSTNLYTTPFVTKLNSTASALVYSTFLGGTTEDSSYGIAVDASGDAFVVGSAFSTDFPVTAGAFQKTNHAKTKQYFIAGNGFLAKLNPAGSGLVYSTYFGGSVADTGTSVAIDSAGDAFVTGSTSSTDFPVTTGVFQPVYSTTVKPPFTDCTTVVAGGVDSFVTKFNPTGSALLYSTFLAGTGVWRESGPVGSVFCSCDGDYGLAIAIDGTGNAYVTGTATSKDFPVTAQAYQTTNRAPSGTVNVFVSKLNDVGTSLLYSTYLGGTSASGDAPGGLAVDAADNIYVTGDAESTNFPVTAGAFQVKDPLVSSALYLGSGFLSKLTPPSGNLLTPKVAVAPASASIQVSQALAVTVTVSGTGATPTGSVTLSSGTYASVATKLGSGKASITIPAKALASGKDTLTAKYTPDAASTSVYATATGTATETVTPNTAIAPVSAPAAGTYTTAQSVKLTSTTPGATIYYTTNGTRPTATSTKYTAPIRVAATETIEAIAVATGYAQSNVAIAKYIIETAASKPTFSPAAGTYAKAQSVKLTSTTAGAAIYYTTDGANPTPASVKYTAAISVAKSETVKAIAVASAHTNSAVASAAYVIETPAATPVFSPAGRTYTATQSVKIASATAGATIYFTTNGTTPTAASTKYTAAISVAKSETVKAVAVASGHTNSAVASAAYVISK